MNKLKYMWKQDKKQILRIALHYVMASQTLKCITMSILPIKFSLTSVKKQHKPDIEVDSETYNWNSEVQLFALETESKLESHIYKLPVIYT